MYRRTVLLIIESSTIQPIQSIQQLVTPQAKAMPQMYGYVYKIKDGLTLPVYYKIVTRNFRYSYSLKVTCYSYKLVFAASRPNLLQLQVTDKSNLLL